MRLPFTSVALVPFAIGAYAAYRQGRLVSLPGAALGLPAVLMICIGCYLLGEVFDQAEDVNTRKYGRSAFAGGTLLVADGVLPRRAVLAVAGAMFAGAAILGTIICLARSAWWLWGLGVFGALAAGTYSLPPVRLVTRGIGELFIGVCYGWLTLATGYACTSGTLPERSVLLCLPIALSISNVIFINEFPDYEADRDAAKRNLLNRLGRPAGAFLYAAVSCLTVAALAAAAFVIRSDSPAHFWLIVPASMLAIWLAVRVGIQNHWRDRRTLESLCALTIVLNHLCSLTLGALFTW